MFEGAAAELSAMFCDTLTAWDYTATTSGGITRETRCLKHSAAPCRLSRKRVSAPSDGGIPQQTHEYVLFTAPGLLLAANDEVEIAHGDLLLRGRAADSHQYDTHCETSITVEGVA